MPGTRIDTGLQSMSNTLVQFQLTKKCILGVFIATIFVAGCAKEKVVAKPINPQTSSAKIFAKNPLSADFKSYLIKQGYAESALPFSAWGIDELTASALFHHTKLDVGKAQLALANAQIQTAGLKQNPTLNGTLARSNRANNDIRPWAYGLNVEIPIETADKRQIRIEEAQHLQEVARLEVADTAWQLRSQLSKDLLRYHENSARLALLQQKISKQTDILNMLQKRVDVGALSNTDIFPSKLLLQTKKDTLTVEQAKSQEIIANLAADAGLTLEKFKQLPIKALDLESTLNKQTESLNANAAKDLQQNALLNRLDIRRGLAKYAAAEANIKLEVAKQTPDISLTPDFIFEFGDKIWSLGFSSLLNLLNNNVGKNKALIAEARQLREIEGAQFEALQANVIGDLSVANAQFMAAQDNLSKAKQQQAAQQVYMQKLNKQFAAGALDRLELAQAALQNQQADAQVLTMQFEVLNAANNIENLLQAPIDLNKIDANKIIKN